MSLLRGGTVRTVGAATAVLAALAAVAMASWPNLNGDVRYALGTYETAGRGGVSIWDMFVSRPLAYKLFMAAIDEGRILLVGDIASNRANLVIRIETYVLILAVVALLFLGVRRIAGRPAAAGIAAATGLALMVSPPWHFLEPDWVAALLAVLAVAVACTPRRAWLGALLAGPVAMLVVAVKLSTFPVALIALLVIGVFDRRRALWTTLSTLVWVGIWYLLITEYQPWEWTWMGDLAHLVHEEPQRIYWDEVVKLRTAIGDVMVLNPVVALAPAAAAVLIRRESGGRRWAGLAVAVVGFAISLAPAYGQGEFFMYHFASTVVLSAGVCGAAYALCPGFRWPVVVAGLLATGVSLVLLRQPADWRLAESLPVTWAYEIFAFVFAVIAWFVAGRLKVSLPWFVGVVALCVAQLPPVLPGNPYSFSTYNYTIPVGRSSDAPLVELGRRLGADTPVLYLSYGTVNHAMGNPTSCRYPSPIWLQRGALLMRMREVPSYDDNLRCLTEPSDARYLIVQNNWYIMPRTAPDVKALINERFDCSPAAQIPAPEPLTVCPARN
ncbi:hypothetical protein M1L60_25005 [Actinoplanes sp. TRM 88003]|uniref:Glycosyltransferase RgtA/B/C/D-like domain-containing protein n=1 Tax=Paractinoplanes aksuensis TaxID=2939490 RepID=A0ABT1DUY4_9ACTN|nr:hypothetical protein [Actinoplanes aksuensis]MCO8273861.1 hypothetical protein [Actinoplanes aksuensis]